MEEHSCKLCSRTFVNGRALGGHMRSHMANLSPSPQQKAQVLNDSASSISSSSSEEEEEEEEGEGEEEKGLYYGLRENPKKSFRLVDPEFSFTADAGTVVQDRESETESSKNPIQRRPKRHRKSVEPEQKSKQKFEVEAEPVSSVSDTTPEEDVALCLMMLSRDIWMRDSGKELEESDDSDEELKFCSRGGKNKFQCGTCKKVFRSYQALGGHRASHKKIRGCTNSSVKIQEADSETRNAGCREQSRRIHECPVCLRVFASGQALGGHKRSHLTASATAAASSAKYDDNLIDLNLPAPIEDDEISQVELSAVSDAEFVEPAR